MILLFHENNSLSSYSMTNENSSFPATNASTQYDEQLAKSITTTTVITTTLTKGDDLFIFNTNAFEGSYTIKSGVTTLDFGLIDFTLTPELDFSLAGYDTNYKNKYVYLGQIYENVTVEISLTADTVPVYCGILMAGVGLKAGDTFEDNFNRIDTSSIEASAAINTASLLTLKKIIETTEAYCGYSPIDTWEDASQYIAFGQIEIKSSKRFLLSNEITFRIE